MRRITSLLLLVILFSSCHFMGGCRVRGNGNVTAQARSVGSLSGVRVVGSMDVILIPGTDYAVKVEADENLLNYILTDRDGDALVIKTRNGYNIQSRAGMKVYVTAPSIESLKITGSGSALSQSKVITGRRLTIDVTGSGDVKLEVDAPEVTAEATGSGNIILAGAIKDFKVGINGSGEAKCFNLMSENTEINIAGSGSGEVFASK